MVAGLRDNFEYEGYDVISASDGLAGLERALADDPDLVVLDVMMPRMSGLDVCKQLKAKQPSIPIIMLTARGQEIDKVVGLELGADDYVTKPFSIRALVARVRALLRRTQGGVKSPSVIRIGGLEINLEKHIAAFNDSPLKLTPNEFKLLHILASRAGHTLTREQLLEDLHGAASNMDRSVDSHIKNLRKKLEAASGHPMIETVYGIGYRMTEG